MTGLGRALVKLLETLDDSDREAALTTCCGSAGWVAAMTAGWPYADDAAVQARADAAWWELHEDDWLEAFGSHPRIGDRDLADRWAGAEQAGVDEASPETLADLAALNREYEERFGHVFLICATGLDAEQMLGALRRRLGNDPAVELQVAAAEQARITQMRLARLAEEGPQREVATMSITLSTHVLDTSTGRPAGGVAVELAAHGPDPSGGWKTVARGLTDDDGRVSAFGEGDSPLGIDPGEYRLRFSTGAYFAASGTPAFHPLVDVVFNVPGGEGHYHVPLLLSPFGYTTYRGS
ncbi:MAG: 2-oxo-4-hydroxy-4-carboxy-5-ureidoimidazoline decarboxylase [Gemmatimonadota bacterium]|nr:2-oxo-4-hydroxy-4-carboxy-5-ureidoimidazoline decarboxylase [Gemmatimonadota bacterium]